MIVLDDVTPLIRTQKIAAWREVARRLAHEIKNPLTPIQLSAERLRRHFAGGPSGAARALVDECTTTIVGEVESLKGLVDEFSQFARMPSPRIAPVDIAALIADTLALYNGIFSDVAIERRFAPDIPLVRLDAGQIRRVMINLVDNAVEATERARARSSSKTQRVRGRTASSVSSWPTTAPAFRHLEREKLFLPVLFNQAPWQPRLGLAIVRRIIAEHGGRISRRRRQYAARDTVFHREAADVSRACTAECVRNVSMTVDGGRDRSRKWPQISVMIASLIQAELRGAEAHVLIVDDEARRAQRADRRILVRDEGYNVEAVPAAAKQCLDRVTRGRDRSDRRSTIWLHRAWTGLATLARLFPRADRSRRRWS